MTISTLFLYIFFFFMLQEKYEKKPKCTNKIILMDNF